MTRRRSRLVRWSHAVLALGVDVVVGGGLARARHPRHSTLHDAPHIPHSLRAVQPHPALVPVHLSAWLVSLPCTIICHLCHMAQHIFRYGCCRSTHALNFRRV